MILLAVSIMACQQTIRQDQTHSEAAAMPGTGIFGAEMTGDGSVPAAELPGLFSGSDTIETKIAGHILASCKYSGCWMDMDMGGQDVVHVTFDEETFTIPLDAAGKNAVVQGIAYRELIPVETLQDYAREDGKTEEEIAAITEPVWSYDFVATGVIIED